MTEYDYSPEAYDRFLHTQQRIAQWVDNTEAHRPEFDPDSSLLHTRPGHRSTRSMHDDLHFPRQRSPSSSSSSSLSEDYINENDIPRSMQHVPGLHPMYQHEQRPGPIDASSRRHHTRRRSSSHHHRSHRSAIQSYMVSPPPNTPEHPYGYTVNRGTIVSPGPYGFTTKGTHTYPTSPPHSNPYSTPTPMSYYNTSYPFSPPSYTSPTAISPPGAYSSFYAPQNVNATVYMSGQQQQQQSYIYPAAYPPMIYPAGAGQPVYPTQTRRHGMSVQQTVTNPKPLFYQRIFGQGKKSKSSSRRSG